MTLHCAVQFAISNFCLPSCEQTWAELTEDRMNTNEPHTNSDNVKLLKAFGTSFQLPSDIIWSPQPDFPALSLENAVLDGSLTDFGLYLTLVKWHPGFMTAPHTYASDRLCIVVSGTWWISSGQDFNPSSCVPVLPGTFVKRLARTPHYDGVPSSGKEPAIIAICGLAPVLLEFVDSTRPAWRSVEV